MICNRMASKLVALCGYLRSLPARYSSSVGGWNQWGGAAAPGFYMEGMQVAASDTDMLMSSMRGSRDTIGTSSHLFALPHPKSRGEQLFYPSRSLSLELKTSLGRTEHLRVVDHPSVAPGLSISP